MRNNGYTNEHGHAGIHRAYGIKMSYHYMRDAKYYIFDSQMQHGKNLQLLYPLVQAIDSDGNVVDCQVDYLVGDVSSADTIRLKFNPAFTGWVLTIGRVFNCELFDYLYELEDNYVVPHDLDAIGFCTVVDLAQSAIDADIEIMDMDSLKIYLSHEAGIRGSVHGLSAPMFRKYAIALTEEPYKRTIRHNLGLSGLVRPPYVMVVDDVGHVVNCGIKHLDMSSIELEFSESFSGYAYLLMG